MLFNNRTEGRLLRYFQSFQTFADLDQRARAEIRKVPIRHRMTMLRQAYAEAHHLYEEDTEHGDPATFLQWLIDNADVIIALILKLVPRFV